MSMHKLKLERYMQVCPGITQEQAGVQTDAGVS